MNEPIPGIKTTEFWVTILVQVVSIAGLMGWLTPESCETYQKAAAQLGSLIAMVVSQVAYAASRSKTKSAATKTQVVESCD